jgi:tetratricopeptide (TPR) repeat protein
MAKARTQPLGFDWFMTLLLRAQQGRWPDVIHLAESAGASDYSWFYSTYAEALIGSGDADRAWRATKRTIELDPYLASNLAVHFAYLGDLPRAAELARYLPAGSPRVDAYSAVVRWRQGDLDGAIDQLRSVTSRTALSAEPAIPAPLYLLGEALSEAGRDAEAIQALRRFQAMPLLYPSWQYPRSLYYVARSQERAGDRAGARETIAGLLRMWKDASPGQPLLQEARALGARLGVR